VMEQINEIYGNKAQHEKVRQQFILQLEDVEKKEKDLLEKLDGVTNEEMMYNDKIKKLDEDIDIIRAKEGKIKVEFERQMDEIKQNAKMIMQAHERQMNEMQSEREINDVEKRKVEHMIA